MPASWARARPARRLARTWPAIVDLVAELPVHEASVDQGIRVGALRRKLIEQGVTVSTPDAHVAQCALDRDAVLLTRDRIFTRIACITKLREARG